MTTSSVSPFQGVELCLASGAPITVVFERNSATNAYTLHGWFNTQTGVFTAGPPPAGTVPCDPLIAGVGVGGLVCGDCTLDSLADVTAPSPGTNNVLHFAGGQWTPIDINILVPPVAGCDTRVARPEDFGAVGDGITDDWHAIQDAVDSLSAATNTALHGATGLSDPNNVQGGRVSFCSPHGYAVSKAVLFEEGMSFVGVDSSNVAGRGTRLVPLASFNGTNGSNTQREAVLKFNKVPGFLHQAKITRLAFDGSALAASHIVDCVALQGIGETSEISYLTARSMPGWIVACTGPQATGFIFALNPVSSGGAYNLYDPGSAINNGTVTLMAISGDWNTAMIVLTSAVQAMSVTAIGCKGEQGTTAPTAGRGGQNDPYFLLDKYQGTLTIKGNHSNSNVNVSDYVRIQNSGAVPARVNIEGLGLGGTFPYTNIINDVTAGKTLINHLGGGNLGGPIHWNVREIIGGAGDLRLNEEFPIVWGADSASATQLSFGPAPTGVGSPGYQHPLLSVPNGPLTLHMDGQNIAVVMKPRGGTSNAEIRSTEDMLLEAQGATAGDGGHIYLGATAGESGSISFRKQLFGAYGVTEVGRQTVVGNSLNVAVPNLLKALQLEGWIVDNTALVGIPGIIDQDTIQTAVVTLVAPQPSFQLTLGGILEVTLTANMTGIALLNGIAGQLVTLVLKQDTTGGHTYSFQASGAPGTTRCRITGGGALTPPHGPLTASTRDIWHLYYTGQTPGGTDEFFETSRAFDVRQ